MYNPVIETKQFRKDLDDVLQKLKGYSEHETEAGHRTSQERKWAMHYITNAILWLGMDLKAMKEEGLSNLENPYPDSYDASNDKVAKTADNLKL